MVYWLFLSTPFLPSSSPVLFSSLCFLSPPNLSEGTVRARSSSTLARCRYKTYSLTATIFPLSCRVDRSNAVVGKIGFWSVERIVPNRMIGYSSHVSRSFAPVSTMARFVSFANFNFLWKFRNLDFNLSRDLIISRSPSVMIEEEWFVQFLFAIVLVIYGDR